MLQDDTLFFVKHQSTNPYCSDPLCVKLMSTGESQEGVMEVALAVSQDADPPTVLNLQIHSPISLKLHPRAHCTL